MLVCPFCKCEWDGIRCACGAYAFPEHNLELGGEDNG